jgi:hypothetical protein
MKNYYRKMNRMDKFNFWHLVLIGGVASAFTRFIYRFIQIRKMRKKEEQEKNENN